MHLALEHGIPIHGRIGGILAVAYLLVLFHAFGALRALLSRTCWVGRLDRRWLDLWLR